MKNECFPPATRLSGWVLNRIHDRANDIATELLIFLTHDWSSVDFQQPCTARAANRVLTQQAGGNSLPYVVFASRHCGNSACSGVHVGCTHKPSDRHLQSVQAYSQHPTSRTLSCQIWAFADGVHTVCTVARSCTQSLRVRSSTGRRDEQYGYGAHVSIIATHAASQCSHSANLWGPRVVVICATLSTMSSPHTCALTAILVAARWA